jgi:hypothetical protein
MAAASRFRGVAGVIALRLAKGVLPQAIEKV